MPATENQIEYVEVSIEEFISGHAIPFDIFIKLSESKYVKLANSGEDLSPDRLDRYKGKNITALYLRKEDFLKYVGFRVKPAEPEADAVAVAPEKAHEQELQELCKLGDLTLELVFFNEMNEVVFGTAKNFVDTTIELLKDSRDAAGLLAPLNGTANFVYAHGVAVSAYCVMIARQMGWKNTANIFKLSIGGLLHDVGKRDLPRELLSKPKDRLKPPEIELIRQHPLLGAQILEKLPSIPEDIVSVVLQHHENMLGHGYPHKRSAVHIHPMARIVAVADAFCNLVLRGPDGPGMKAPDAVGFLELRPDFDPEPIAALRQLFSTITA